MKKFFIDMVNNPDGTFSSKRVAGWIALFNLIGLLWFGKPEHIVTTALIATVAFWGLTSLDYKSFLGNKPTPDPDTPAA